MSTYPGIPSNWQLLVSLPISSGILSDGDDATYVRGWAYDSFHRGGFYPQGFGGDSVDGSSAGGFGANVGYWGVDGIIGIVAGIRASKTADAPDGRISLLELTTVNDFDDAGLVWEQPASTYLTTDPEWHYVVRDVGNDDQNKYLTLGRNPDIAYDPTAAENGGDPGPPAGWWTVYEFTLDLYGAPVDVPDEVIDGQLDATRRTFY